MSSITPTPERLSAMEEWASEYPDRLGETYMRELLTAYRTEVAAREKAESEREELHVMLERRTFVYGYQWYVWDLKESNALLARIVKDDTP